MMKDSEINHFKEDYLYEEQEITIKENNDIKEISENDTINDKKKKKNHNNIKFAACAISSVLIYTSIESAAVAPSKQQEDKKEETQESNEIQNTDETQEITNEITVDEESTNSIILPEYNEQKIQTIQPNKPIKQNNPVTVYPIVNIPNTPELPNVPKPSYKSDTQCIMEQNGENVFLDIIIVINSSSLLPDNIEVELLIDGHSENISLKKKGNYYQAKYIIKRSELNNSFVVHIINSKYNINWNNTYTLDEDILDTNLELDYINNNIIIKGQNSSKQQQLLIIKLSLYDLNNNYLKTIEHTFKTKDDGSFIESIELDIKEDCYIVVDKIVNDDIMNDKWSGYNIKITANTLLQTTMNVSYSIVNDLPKFTFTLEFDQEISLDHIDLPITINDVAFNVVLKKDNNGRYVGYLQEQVAFTGVIEVHDEQLNLDAVINYELIKTELSNVNVSISDKVLEFTGNVSNYYLKPITFVFDMYLNNQYVDQIKMTAITTSKGDFVALTTLPDTLNSGDYKLKLVGVFSGEETLAFNNIVIQITYMKGN